MLPALDIEVADFELRGRKLGALALQAAHRPAPGDPAGRSEWQLTRLRLKNDDATLSADGRWETGFICEQGGIEDARDITAYGGWRGYLRR